jgi:hypothetical protein
MAVLMRAWNDDPVGRVVVRIDGRWVDTTLMAA